MTRPISDRPRSWSWSCTFGLASNTVVPDKTLCEMIMLKCNKHLYFSCNKCRNSAKRNWSSCYFLTFFAQSNLLITNMHDATEKFFCCVVLLLLYWFWSCSYNFGAGLDVIVFVLILVLTFWFCFHH